jgi:hypothetical protein
MHHKIRPVTIIATILLAIVTFGSATKLHAETRYLECAGLGVSDGVRAMVTIDFDTRMVTVLSGAFRWQARGAQIADDRITWEVPWGTRSRSGTAYYTLNRYNGELWVRNAPGVLQYNCTQTEKPQKKL